MHLTSFRISVFWVTAFVLSAGAATAAAGDPPAEGSFAPANVLVVVENHNGWGKSTCSGLSCDGRFSILGAYSDTTTIRGTVAPDSALALVNELLALNFFELPDLFGAGRQQLAYLDDQHLAYLWEMTFDAGSSKIELHVGPENHTVVLAFPAHGAPAALRDWLKRFQRFMKENRGW